MNTEKSIPHAQEYLTLAGGREVVGEFCDRKSRFIAQLCHARSEREAEGFISQVRARRHDARHNVPAWILSDGRERCSDDGEPQRTAGMPTLDVLRGAGLADACCVVTRYFGGVLLGPGGLARAYAAATQAAIEEARSAGLLVRMTLVTRVTCTIPYAAYGRVERMVADCGGRLRDSIFSEEVQLTCAFPSGTEGAFLSGLRELANGEELCVVGKPAFSEL